LHIYHNKGLCVNRIVNQQYDNYPKYNLALK
jgi:hypothetical protein